MKRAVLACAALLAAAAAVADSTLKTKVTAATVYSEGASITREGALALIAGDQVIELPGLPAGLDESAVQVELTDSRVRIGQIKQRLVAQARAQDEEVRNAEDALARAQSALKAIEDEDQGADLTLKFLDGLATGYAKEAWTDSANASGNPDSWQRAIAVLQQGSAQARKTKRDNVAARTDAQRLVQQRQRELNALRGGRPESTVLQVAVNAPAALDTRVRVVYFVEDARWSPIYEARLNSDDGQLELAQRAVVIQETDEPWRNIALSLATGDPLGELEAPTLESEFLGLWAPEPRRAKRSRLAGIAQASGARDASIEEVIVTGSRVAAPEVSAFAITYPIPGAVDLDNDSDEDQLFDLSRDQFGTTLITQAVPRQSTQAFLAARFTYESDLPLYRSAMKVYVDGVFAGSSVMPDALPGAEVTLPMGQDRRVTVETRNQGGVGGESGLIGKKRREVTDFVYRITNRRDQNTVVEVRDLVPVSRDRAVKVQVARNATTPTEQDVDGAAGLVLWRKILTGGETWELRHGYSVEYPADRELQPQ
jgi:uncharacterized protein (TIGR02231 family)